MTNIMMTAGSVGLPDIAKREPHQRHRSSCSSCGSHETSHHRVRNHKKPGMQLCSTYGKTHDHDHDHGPSEAFQARRGLNTEAHLTFVKGQEVHDDHVHDVLVDPRKPNHVEAGLKPENEICACCMFSTLDMDELLGLEKLLHASGEHHSLAGELPDFGSGSHIAVTGVGGGLALLGLTAAYRNIMGTWSNRKAIQGVVRQIDQTIAQLKKDPANEARLVKLKAIRRGLGYSQFDNLWNMSVPGAVNGTASAGVMSTIVWTHPWALPFVQLYALLQTGRNVYDSVRFWNHRFKADPVEKTINHDELALANGKRKMDAITKRKRIFYPSNSLGFASVAAGASLLFVSAIGVLTGGAAPLIAGAVLLTCGALFTGVTNNIWTRKFRPRNGDIGLNRQTAELDDYIKAVGESQRLKKIIKDEKRHLMNQLPKGGLGYTLRKAGWQALFVLPFLSRRAMSKNHQVNQEMIGAIGQLPRIDHDHRRLELATKLADQALPTRFVSDHRRDQGNYSDFVRTCLVMMDLGLLETSLKTFLIDHDHEAVSEGDHEDHHHHGHDHGHCHDHGHEHGACNHGHDLGKKLRSIGGFNEAGKYVSFNPQAFEQKASAVSVQKFKKAIDSTLFAFEETLRYQQYGAETAYWNLFHTRRS